MGFVQDSIVIADGANLALAGVKPSGIAAQGKVIWQAITAPQWQLLASTYVSSSGSATTPAIDTTGVNLLVIVISGDLASIGTVSVSDNQNNTWTKALVSTPDSTYPYGATSVIFYCIHPLISTQHTFTGGFSTGGSGFGVLGFKTPASIIVDQSSIVAGRFASSLSLPSITPSAASNLVITGIGSNVSATAVNNNFSIVTNIPFTSGVAYACASAYQIQASSVAPTWTLAGTTGTAGASATMLSFKAAPWQLLASTLYSLGSTSGTSQPINTTGAKLIVVMNSTYTPVNAALSDSLSNTWTQIPYVAARANLQMWYCLQPTTGTAHTFTFSSGNYSNIVIMAFSCAQNVAFDQITTIGNNTAGLASLQLPALTTSAQNCLLISGIANGYSIYSIDSNFLIAQNGAAASGSYFGVAGAYLIQSNPASISPTWQVNFNANYPGMSSALLSFKPS